MDPLRALFLNEIKRGALVQADAEAWRVIEQQEWRDRGREVVRPLLRAVAGALESLGFDTAYGGDGRDELHCSAEIGAEVHRLSFRFVSGAVEVRSSDATLNSVALTVKEIVTTDRVKALVKQFASGLGYGNLLVREAIEKGRRPTGPSGDHRHHLDGFYTAVSAFREHPDLPLSAVALLSALLDQIRGLAYFDRVEIAAKDSVRDRGRAESNIRDLVAALRGMGIEFPDVPGDAPGGSVPKGEAPTAS